MPDPSAANSNNTGKRGSKGSLKPNSRRGSLASNSSKQAAVITPQRQERPKRRGFLSFLNCCSPSENATEVELSEQAVQPREKKAKTEDKSNKQQIPSLKPAQEGSKEPKRKEEIGGPEYSQITPQEEPKMQTRSSKSRESKDPQPKPGTPNESTKTAPKNEPESSGVKDAPLPPLPSSSSTEDDSNRASKVATSSEPPKIVDPDESVAVQGTVINDRTVQQEARDTDTAMPDAPPLPAARDSNQDAERELAQAQRNLPPPPPRNGQDRALSRETNNTNERHTWLLPPLQPSFKGKKCLVLDLDETLVHSSFKVSLKSTSKNKTANQYIQMLHQADFTIPVEIESQLHNVYVIKRPGVDQFMKRVGELYEVVVFTASVAKVRSITCLIVIMANTQIVWRPIA